MKLLIGLIFICLSSQAYADWKQENFSNSSFWIYLPKNISTNVHKNSLMINLHGCSQKADDLKADGNWTNTADDYNMIVVLPKVPNGGKYMGCWDYYGDGHTRTNRDNGFLLDLVKNLLARTELKIDSNQVYVSGLSSGGGEAMVLGCMAPDVFAGIGLNAGPTVGTTANEIGKAPVNFDAFVKNCNKLANDSNNAKNLKTQLTSIIYGNNDFIVNTKHDLMNADVLSVVYDAKNKSTFDTKKLEGTNTDGTGTLWSDETGPRISLIMNSNLGHNWPAGQGGNGGNFVNKKSINYPLYLARFFSENNRRTKNVFRPEIQIYSIEARENRLFIQGRVNLNNQKNTRVELSVSDANSKKEHLKIPIKINRNNSFEILTDELIKGEYAVDLNLISNSGLTKTFNRKAWIGEIPGAMYPQLFNAHFESTATCIAISGQAVNNGSDKIVGIEILIDGQNVERVSVENTFWNYRNCSLAKGEHIIKAFAMNEIGNQSNEVLFHAIIGVEQVTARLIEHMNAHRLSYEQYGIWFEKYQDQPFTL